MALFAASKKGLEHADKICFRHSFDGFGLFDFGNRNALFWKGGFALSLVDDLLLCFSSFGRSLAFSHRPLHDYRALSSRSYRVDDGCLVFGAGISLCARRKARYFFYRPSTVYSGRITGSLFPRLPALFLDLFLFCRRGLSSGAPSQSDDSSQENSPLKGERSCFKVFAGLRSSLSMFLRFSF